MGIEKKEGTLEPVDISFPPVGFTSHMKIFNIFEVLG